MKTKLKKIKSHRDRSDDGLPFTERERTIFRFCDHGERCPNAHLDRMCRPGCRRIDPSAVYDVLVQAGESFSNDLKLLDTPLPDNKVAEVVGGAMKRISAWICKAFGVREIDDKYGLTRSEVLALFFEFGRYVAECKKKADDLRTSLGLAQPPVFPSVESIIKRSSASNSTPAASAPTSPSSSVPVSDSHSGPIPVSNSGTQ